jgi:acetyltransferase
MAEVQEATRRRLVGVGRLVADVDHQAAEYAVLVIDEFQGRGLGSLLTSYCVEIARAWQLKRVFAETTPDNHRMLATFRKWGFELDYKLARDVVVARKGL